MIEALQTEPVNQAYVNNKNNNNNNNDDDDDHDNDNNNNNITQRV